MTMSLETMATSHTYHSGTSKPTSQPTIRITSLDSKNPLGLSNQKNSGVKLSWPKMSVALSSESSSNCQYETSSEGPLRKVQAVVSMPMTVRRASRNTHPFEDSKSANENVSGFVIKDGRDSIERSESLPVLRKNRLWDVNDRISSRQESMLDRIMSESSQARMDKFQRIVAYIESTGWLRSDVTLSSKNASDDSTALVRLSETKELTHPVPVIQESFRFFNKTKGITFLPVNDNEKEAVTGTRSIMDYHHYRPVIDDLINIAKNENPSIKSMYFPPNPESPLLTSDRRSVAGDSKNARIFARHRSDRAALSRIENELVPLRNEFSELAGKVRALNLTGTPYNFCVGPWIKSIEPSETLSRDTSGYFLHRAQVFCHNDSPRESSTIHDSRATVLPTVDNTPVVGNFAAKSSCIWYENTQTDYLQTRSMLQMSAEPPRASCKNPLLLGNNKVRFFHEKPFAYGVPCDFRIGHDDYPEKPMCFGSTAGASKLDHLSLYHWSKQGSVLPTDDTRHLQNNFSQFLNDSKNNIQCHAMSKQMCSIIPNDIDEFNKCSESKASNFHSIDGKFRLPRANDGNLEDDCESPCVERTHSTARGILAVRSSTKQKFSKKSQCSIRSDDNPHMVRQRHCSKEKMVSQEISNRDRMKHHDKRKRSETIERMTQNSRTSHITDSNEFKFPEKMIPNEDKFVSTEQRDSQGSKVRHTMDIVFSHPVGKIGIPPGNSKSLDIEAKTSFIRYSQVLKPSRPSIEICELDNSALAQKQRIKFRGAYTEQTILRMNSAAEQKVTNFPGHIYVPFPEMLGDPHQPETPEIPRQFEKVTQDRRAYEKELRLPVSDEKITIVPVMYTSRIPEAPNKYDTTICRRKKIDKKTSDRRRSMVKKKDKLTERSERSITRRSSILSTDASEASPSFTSPLSYLTDQNYSFFEHEKSWLGQWRTDSRFSVSYGRSNISVSSTLNTERTLKTVASRLTMIQSPKTSITNPDTFYKRSNSPIALRISDSNYSKFHRTKNYTPMNSARGRSNDQVIGISTSPDDFFDNA